MIVEPLLVCNTKYKNLLLERKYSYFTLLCYI